MICVPGICERARYTEPVIVGQYEWRGFLEGHPLPVAHSVALRCGRPVPVVPESCRSCSFDRIVVAWDGSREAVRAATGSWSVVAHVEDMLSGAPSVHVVKLASF